MEKSLKFFEKPERGLYSYYGINVLTYTVAFSEILVGSVIDTKELFGVSTF
jgi:hypothetical protein